MVNIFYKSTYCGWINVNDDRIFQFEPEKWIGEAEKYL
jgi:hypothetical protein